MRFSFQCIFNTLECSVRLFFIRSRARSLSISCVDFGSPLLVNMVKDSWKVSHKRTYEDAICTLNGLQTNAALLAQIRKERGSSQKDSLPEMQTFLLKLNIKVCDLDQLNIIHISGTKGKGSTSAFCESIMRHSGLRTGFYSSPHIVEVRERIHVNGKPLDRSSFAKYFFECYDKLIATSSEHSGDMPGYFRFLTLMAFHVFLHEQLDVVIMEVGIGGSYDCTNITRKPAVCGICKLELDHTPVLGDTIEQIAWHKSGIMKPDVPVICLPQVENAEKVLFQRAKELKAHSLHFAPTPELYDQDLSEIGLAGAHQEVNAALALQLCRVWFHQRKEYLREEKKADHLIQDTLNSVLKQSPFNAEYLKYLKQFEVPEPFLKGLKKAYWPGRCELIKRRNITFYIDGAHTPGSIEACIKWIKSRHLQDIPVTRENTFRVLLFNLSGGRDEYTMLKSLSELGFDHAVFCPNIIETKPGESSSDMTNFNVTRDARLRVCDHNQNTWLSLHAVDAKLESAIDTSSSHIAGTTLETSSITSVFPSISAAVKWIVNGRDSDIDKPELGGPDLPTKMINSEHTQLVVTGSLHLVGGVMKFIGPNICKIYGD